MLACIMRKKGKTIRISSHAEKSVSTIHNWLTRISNDGIKKIYDKKIPGCPSKMSHDQLKELRKDLVAGPQACGFESGVWTAPLLREHIDRKYGVKYATSSIYDILEKCNSQAKDQKAKTPKISPKVRDKSIQKKASEFVRVQRKRIHDLGSGLCIAHNRMEHQE